MELIDISIINELPEEYPNEFILFCENNNINIPNIKSKRGIALSLMLKYKNKYWNRDTCNLITEKFNIKTKDSIQLFNKQSQIGIKTNSGIET